MIALTSPPSLVLTYAAAPASLSGRQARFHQTIGSAAASLVEALNGVYGASKHTSLPSVFRLQHELTTKASRPSGVTW